MPFTTVTVTGTLKNSSGDALSGIHVQFALTQVLMSTDNGIMATNEPETVVTDNSGNFSIPLIATDDAYTTPRGQVYVCKILSSGNTPYGQFASNTSFPTYYFALPYTNSPTVSFASLIYSSMSFQGGIVDNSTKGILIKESGASAVAIQGAGGVTVSDSSASGISLTGSPIKLSSGTTAIKVYTAASIATLPTTGLTVGSLGITADYRIRFWNGSAWVTGS